MTQPYPKDGLDKDRPEKEPKDFAGDTFPEGNQAILKLYIKASAWLIGTFLVLAFISNVVIRWSEDRVTEAKHLQELTSKQIASQILEAKRMAGP